MFSFIGNTCPEQENDDILALKRFNGRGVSKRARSYLEQSSSTNGLQVVWYKVLGVKSTIRCFLRPSYYYPLSGLFW